MTSSGRSPADSLRRTFTPEVVLPEAVDVRLAERGHHAVVAVELAAHAHGSAEATAQVEQIRDPQLRAIMRRYRPSR
jgi:hypothetical protein